MIDGKKDNKMNKTQIGAHRTAVFNDDGIHKVVYHSTIIFEYNPKDGICILNSGGYLTLTTKKRTNQCLEFFGIDAKIHQRDFTWYAVFNGNEYKFKDKMVLDLMNKTVNYMYCQ